ncbi:hypothetical protein LSAT2_026931, partial [Lamellibrachia satsuma]
ILNRSTTKHANTDCLSRLTPDCREGHQSYDTAELFHTNQVNMLAVNSDKLRRKMSKIPTRKVLQLTVNDEWSTRHKHNSDLAQYYQWKDELDVQL